MYSLFIYLDAFPDRKPTVKLLKAANHISVNNTDGIYLKSFLHHFISGAASGTDESNYDRRVLSHDSCMRQQYYN